MESISRICSVCCCPSIQPINLKCDHHPCYSCANSITTIDSDAKLQCRYKIICPTCHRKTVFYDLRHLIITQTLQNQQQLYVTDKFVTKFHSKKNSIHSVMLPSVEVHCPKHNHHITAVCLTCDFYMVCKECVGQRHSKHKTVPLKQVLDKLWGECVRKKEGLDGYAGQINKQSLQLNSMYGVVQDNKQQLDCQLKEEFSKIYDSLGKKYQEMKESIQKYYEQSLFQIQQINKHIELLKEKVISIPQKEQVKGMVEFHIEAMELIKQYRKVIEYAGKTINIKELMLCRNVNVQIENIIGIGEIKRRKMSNLEEWRASKENIKPIIPYGEQRKLKL